MILGLLLRLKKIGPNRGGYFSNGNGLNAEKNKSYVKVSETIIGRVQATASNEKETFPSL